MLAPGWVRERSRRRTICCTVMKVSRVMIASWVGWEDHTHWSMGLGLPRRVLVARRFHTMYPVYLG
ncbi:MAG: hypothetical protein M3Y48_12160 [Actinomycetota bacterium]|nr:hypothetical protein [Actinomycetota bacterium]